MLQIDKEVTQLIVDIYSKINAIKRLQQEAEYLEINDFILSGELLSKKMNGLFSNDHQTSEKQYQQFNEIKALLNSLSQQNQVSFENKCVLEIADIVANLQINIDLLEKHFSH